jgi:hypothetical protein
VSWENTMNTMLPPLEGGAVAGMTGHYGDRRGNSRHGGSDFNYRENGRRSDSNNIKIHPVNAYLRRSE